MSYRNPTTRLGTHEVGNQPPPFEDVNRYTGDAALRHAVRIANADFAERQFHELGSRVGSAEVQAWAAEANRHPPELRAFDRYGHRVDEVAFHPAWHALMQLGIEAGVSAIAWSVPVAGHTAHSALMYLMTAADAGVCCPFSMTYAAMPVLRRDPSLAAEWEPGLLSQRYDPSSRPAAEKAGTTIGMAMTEKQGGSDVRTNSTRATGLRGEDEYRLTGHKWFCSAPMSDAFFTLAQTGAGPTCFFVPRWLPDGTRNAIHIVRLKDKLGDRSNASAEIEYHDARARRVGAEGQGVRTIIDMVQGTRLDCMIGSAALMRHALASALWHCRFRRAFGQALIEQPSMMRVLAELAIEQEAALALAFRVARAFDAAATSEAEAAVVRIVTPIAKYWICKRTPAFVYEALECHGGNGFVEESPLPRYFRQSPLNSIWEGSGNVIALDVLRAVRNRPDLVARLLQELDGARGHDPHLDRLVDDLPGMATELNEHNVRHFVERAAIALQASVLLANAPEQVARGFIATRVTMPAGTFGASPADIDCEALIERASPGCD